MRIQMASIVSAVTELESRRKALELELANVNSRLKAIQQALDASIRAESNGAGRGSEPASTGSSRSEISIRRTARKKVRELRQWFASGAAAGPMTRLVRAPMTASGLGKPLEPGT